MPRGAVNTGSRIALRNWRISTRLVSLLALPVVAATTLGGLRINDSMNDIQQLDHMQLLTQMTKQATTLAQALQEERDRSAGPLANGVKADDPKVAEPRKRTDRAKSAFFEATNEIGNTDDDEALEGIHSSVAQIAGQLGQIRDIRKDAYAKGSPSLQTVDAYSQLITSLLSLSQDMAQATSNPEMIKRTRALAAFSSAKEYASVQRAIIAAALPGGGVPKGIASRPERPAVRPRRPPQGDAGAEVVRRDLHGHGTERRGTDGDAGERQPGDQGRRHLRAEGARQPHRHGGHGRSVRTWTGTTRAPPRSRR